MLKSLVLLATLIFAALAMAKGTDVRVQARMEVEEDRAAIVRLGARLFRDERFSTPDGDLPASCSNCHLYDQDPQGLRAYTDFFNRSWVSSRTKDRRRLGLRNAPTILDVEASPRLHYDGEFGSLEELVKGTISGRPMGWLPGEEGRAFDLAQAVVRRDQGEGAADPYRKLFDRAFKVDLDRIGRDQTIELIAKAVAAYCRTLRTRRDSPYDRFVELNGLPDGAAAGESGKELGRRLLARLDALEATAAVSFTPGFGAIELQGMKTFYRSDRGNCVGCHAPPLFTDHSFHNLGISQREYDLMHGEGKFAVLAIPDAAEAVRPAARFREIPSKGKPGEADLGFWNYVDLRTSPLRRAGERDDVFLRRMIATFKTPTLRNLRYSQPYLHDGSLLTLEEVLTQISQLSDLARQGRVRAAAEDLARINLAAEEITPLAAFLSSLNEDLGKAPYEAR